MRSQYFLLAILLFATSQARAQTIVVEPDDFENLTDLTNAVPQVTLSPALNDGSLIAGFTIISLSVPFGIPSTGDLHFGTRSIGGFGPQFFSFHQLRADFDAVASSVSIDIIGCCAVPGDETVGTLRAFDSSGVMVDSYVTSPLGEGVVETATVTASDGIAYVLVGSAVTGGPAYLDNLVATLISQTVSSLLEQLLTDSTGVGPGKSLANKVSLAQTYYAVPDIQATCAVLEGFLHEVRAQSGKKLSTAQAQALSADAATVMQALDCG